MLLTLLLKLADGGDGGGFWAVILGIAGVLTLFGLSISWLFERRTRKRGLIGLGVSLLLIGGIVLAVVL